MYNFTLNIKSSLERQQTALMFLIYNNYKEVAACKLLNGGRNLEMQEILQIERVLRILFWGDADTP